MSFLEITFFHNTVLTYLIFAGALLCSLIVIRVATQKAMRWLGEWAERKKTPAAEMLVRSMRHALVPAFYLAAVLLCLKIIMVSPDVQNIIQIVVRILIAYISALLLARLATFFMTQYWQLRRKGNDNKSAVMWIIGFVKVLIWSLVGILLLQNLGVKIDALIAGLGISSLAVAFAAQVVLEDVFCFFSILLDRPLEIGDFIQAGDHSGTVEHIGVKTTRLRTLEGEQLIMSNKDITSSRIQNFKTLQNRRVLFHLSVTYDTTAQTLREIPGLIRQIIEDTPDARFGRAHFSAFSDSSLDFEIVYTVLSNDYDRFMDVRQSVFLQIKETFDHRKISFAFPTRTVQIAPTPGSIAN